MITVAEALAILKDNLPGPKAANLPLEEAFSRRLAADIHAPEPAPRYTSSAMDGYAICWQDFADAAEDTPLSLEIVGESQAGVPYNLAVGRGEAIRISTGAMMPDGADTVVRVEDTEEGQGRVVIHSCKKQGQDVRYAGEEFASGSKILDKGETLKARQIALLSAVGVKQVPVFMEPKVSLFVTGTELAHYEDSEIKPYQVRDSNAPMLRSAVREAGGSVVECRHVGDDLADTVASLSRGLICKSDIILCSGGVSVGRHDHVKEAAEKVGFQQLFWKIRQKPGKPLFVAKKEQTLLFGLPGNPVSAFMCFQNYVLPSLAALQDEEYLHHSLSARVVGGFVNNGKRTDFVRVKINDKPQAIPAISPVIQQGSHMLSSIVKADGYIVLEPGQRLEPGDLAEVFVF